DAPDVGDEAHRAFRSTKPGPNSQAERARITQADQPLADIELPRVPVPAKPVAPGGERAQGRSAPARNTHVHHGWKAAAQHRGKIANPVAQTIRYPGRTGMAPVCVPLWVRPFVRCRRKLHRLTLKIPQLREHARSRCVMAIGWLRQRRVDVDHDFRLWVSPLD